MTAQAEAVLAQALLLSDGEREHLADSLWRSTHGFSSAEIAQEWNLEAERRIDEIDNGTAQLIPHDEVMREMRAKLRSE